MKMNKKVWAALAGLAMALATLFGALSDAEAGATTTLALNSTIPAATNVQTDTSFLNMQTDGNLVLYEKPATPLWAAKPYAGLGSWAKFLSTGDFAVYNSSNALKWHTNTDGIGATSLVIRGDRFTINDAYGPLWDSVDSPEQMQTGKKSSIPVIDPNFEDIMSTTTYAGTAISLQDHTGDYRDWHIRHALGPVTGTITDVSDGARFQMSYSGSLSYLYLRQIIADVYQFEGKTIKIVVDYTNDSTSSLSYDVYVMARFNPDNATRVFVGDTSDATLTTGSHTISKTFTVPSFSLPAESTEGLSVAFRMIGSNQTSDVTIHSVRVIVTNP